MYQLTSNSNYVIDLDNGTFVPVSGTWLSEKYQAWLALGNTPQAYVAPPTSTAPSTSKIAPIMYAALAAMNPNDYSGMVYELMDSPGAPGDVVRSVGGQWLRSSDNSPVV